MKKRVLWIGTAVAAVLVVGAVVAFTSWWPQGSPVTTSKCAGCHGDADRMAELSELPDRFYVDPAQYAQEAHGGLACTTCHRGDPTQDNPQAACLAGKAYANPAATEIVAQTCGSCHGEITARSLQSVHSSLAGIHQSLVDLLGEKEGTAKFESTCNQCHTTCASCHMEEPDRRDILWPRVTSHQFQADSNSNACAACHNGMGDTFFGTTSAPKHEASLMAQAGMQCVDCHGDRDVHGTGTKTTFVMESPKPTCVECHLQPVPRVTSAKDTLVAPQYSVGTVAHAIHPESELACEACHTQWYQSCWNCHDGRTDKTVESLYLAVSPLTGKVQPAAHSPATSGATGPIPDSVGGGWAIKSRHSWGASQTCEACHTDAAVYVAGADRQAPFVASWAANRFKASFVDEKLAQILVVDTGALKQGVHKDQTCDDCHQSIDDAVCAACHTKTTHTGQTVLPADGDWSRTSYAAVKASLEQTAGLIENAQANGTNVAAWKQEWDSLHASYLQVGQAFHAEPGPTLAKAKELGVKSQALLQTVQQATQARPRQDWPAVTLLLVGLVGAVALGGGVAWRAKR